MMKLSLERVVNATGNGKSLSPQMDTMTIETASPHLEDRMRMCLCKRWLHLVR